MPKYGQLKYKTFKYGRYRAVKSAIGRAVRYRLNNVINQTIVIDGNLSDLRIKGNDGDYILCQSIVIDNNIRTIRIRTDSSAWTISTRITLEEATM